ncbi:hypothetical protein [Microbacterium sp. SD291]|uniref:hypothetical protein n=1 Tax=Microbacterium sp. SD291 TaxID=2782007 RepID=UPI001A961C03|nr:hypothetical protein [Microbacterium sp. SD291]MBO0979953.1 hypothetical protein [Microbacterium sp. SD291]
MKRCGTCGRLKSVAEFNQKSSRSDGRQETCRECNREASRRYYRRNREHHIAVIRTRTKAQKETSIAFLAEYFTSHPCIDCGEPDLRVLDFDHRPGSAKRDSVMRLVRNGHPLATIAAEIEKCDVRCRNCHAIVTYERMGGSWRSRVSGATGSA